MRAAIQNKKGFTIVELMVVVVVVGILAGIVAVSYNSWRTTTAQNEVKSNLNGVFSAMESARTFSNSFPLSIPSTISAGQNVTLTYTRGNASSFCITGTSTAVPSVVYYADSSFDKEVRQGSCPALITNLATNPSVDVNGNLWAARWYGAGGGSGTTALTASARYDGINGYRKTWTVAGGGQDIGFNYTQPVVAGKTYAFSAYIRASVVTGHRAIVQWRDGANATISSVTPAEVSIPANTWQRLSATGTAPANAVSAVFIWGPYPGSGAPTAIVGQTVDFDALMVTEGSTVYNYADGDSAHWSWNGTPNASTSTGLAL